MAASVFTALDNSKKLIDSDSIDIFRSNFSGTTVLPSDEEYDDVRLIWNRSFDRHPSLIAFCKGVADVMECVSLWGQDRVS